MAVADEGSSALELPNYSDILNCAETSTQNTSQVNQPDYCLAASPFYWYENDPHWSGFVVGGQSNLYSEVKAHIVTPVDRSVTCGDSYWGAWVGIGGYHTESLIQAGITNNPQVAGEYIFFIEYLNHDNQNLAIYVPSQSFKAGVNLLISVSFNQTTGRAMFYLIDYSTGKSYTRTTNGDVSSYYDGSSAEWINEKNGPTYFNFGTFNWTQAQVRLLNGTWVDFGSQPGHGIQVTNSNGDLLSSPQFFPITSSSFSDKFYQCF